MREIRKNDPDAEAVAAAKAGDKAAFAALLRGLQNRVYHFIQRQSISTQDAEDLTQETFLEVYRSLPSFRGTSQFSTWVLGISQNLIRNYRNRSPVFRFPEVSEDVLTDLPDQQERPDENYQNRLKIEALRAGIQRFLSEDLRDALVLVSLEGLDYAEAANILGVPVGTVKTRVFRARKALKDGLQKEGQWELFF